MRRAARFSCLLLLLLMAACASDRMHLPSTLPEPERTQTTVTVPAPEEHFTDHTRVEVIVPLAANRPHSKAAQALPLPAGRLTLNADAMPLNRFVHLALSEVLKLPIEVDPDVAKREDPVTLHVGQPVTAADLLGMVEDTLALFDVGLSLSAKAVRILPASRMTAAPPDIASERARALIRLGRVIEFIPLRYASPGEVLSFARHFLDNTSAGNIITYARFNAVLVIGKAAHVDRFRQAIALVDRPALKEKHMRLVYPVYWQAEELSRVMEKMLKAQGVPFAQAAIRDGMQLISVPEINAIIVVSPEASWLDALITMVKRLDLPKATGGGSKRFVYFVKNARAKELGKVIMQTLSGESSIAGGESQKKSASVPRQGKSPQPALKANMPAAVGQTGGLAVITDEIRNALIFVGSAEAYRGVLPLLQALDKPPRQVLIEVTIAEVTLDDSTQFGVEAAVSNIDNSSTMTGLLSTIGGLGVGGAGLSYTLIDAASSVRLKINALAREGRAKVLSSPTLLAMDNEEARMQIGDQIAILTQEVGDVTANSGGTTGILRSFNYVDTGVILSVTPTINEGGMVRLKLHQEVSRPGASSNNTPPISRRSVDTTLVAKSGQTVLIGGLISHQTTVGRTKVPLLGDIPILGHLFSNDTVTEVATELIVLITPHIISGPDDAEYLTRAFQNQLGWVDEMPAKAMEKKE